MYPVGLQPLASAFLASGWTTQVAIALLGVVLILHFTFALANEEDDGPTWLPQHSFLNLIPFYSKRHDFLRWGFWITGEPLFRFNLLGRTVVAVSGQVGRRTFFNAKGLDLHEGFQSLSGAIPIVKGVTSDLHARSIQLISRRLGCVQKEDRLIQLIPLLLTDCKQVFENWGKDGILDPFERVYELVFQTSVRSLSCAEIADDTSIVRRLKSLYDILDRGNTSVTVLLPLLPSPAAMRNWWATKQIHDIILGAINARANSGSPQHDTLQMLLDEGDDKTIIVGFMMGLIVASARSTGTTASWLLTFLGSHPEWRNAIKAEFQDLLDYHASLSPSSSSDEVPLSTRLAAIPLESWERSTPVFDRVLHETLRLAQPHVAMRRNVGPEFHIGDKAIPTGTYVVYPFADIHLDDKLYPDPWKFDPSRPEPKEAYSYAGWGAGKIVCQGQRLARLELKLITAMMLLGFDYSVTDKMGSPAPPPRPNWNDTLTCRPPGGSCCFKYTRTDRPL